MNQLIADKKRDVQLDNAIATLEKLETETVKVAELKFKVATFKIRGDAPLVMNRFAEKARQQIIDTQTAGRSAKSRKERTAKDFEECFRQATHRSVEGWCGIPATAIKRALVDACTLVDFFKTKARKAFFIQSDGFGPDGTALIKILNREPKMAVHPVRLPNGSLDMRSRPMFDVGWESIVSIKFDADMFSTADISNLMMRAGQQVGILEGRPASPSGIGQGWGTFEVVND